MSLKDTAVATGFSLLLNLLVSGTAMAKGGVEQITITGPALEEPVQITDSRVLDQFNPWGGLLQFLGGLGKRLDEDEAASLLDDRYEVRFLAGVHQWVYQFSHYTSRDGDAGYIALPEPQKSQGFVLPAGLYRSSEAWTAVMSEQLEGLVMATEQGSVAPAWRQLPVVLSAIAVLSLVVAARRFS